MARPPTVSVLVPTYNYAKYLPETIDSILRQDWTDCEIIISDDASNDDSAALIRAYAARDPRIRSVVHASNLGMVANWNWGLREARGRYVKFLFGDDCLLSPRALSTLVDLLEKNPSAALATSARTIIDEHSHPVGSWRQIGPPGLYAGQDAIARCLYHDYNLIGEPSAVLFRRADCTRGFDPALKQMVDLEFWFHLLLSGDLVTVNQPLCGFRRHALQQTAANRDSQTGPRESLHLATAYLPLIRDSLGEFSRQKILHRRLHYSHKRLPRIPEVERMEQSLRAQLHQPGFMFAALTHHVLRPLQNTRRLIHRKSVA